MKTLALVLLLNASGFAAEVPRATEADRAKPAPVAVTAPAAAATAVKAALANGLSLVLLESHRLPLVAVTLVIPQAGADADPSGKEGLASLVAAMAKEGVTGLPSAAAFSNAVDDLGASLSVTSGADGMAVSVLVLKENLGRALELVGRVVREPSYLSGGPEATAAFKRLRQETLTGLEMEKGDPAAVAGKRLAAGLFGDSPRGRAETEASINSLTLAEVAARHRASVVPNGAVLAVTGDVKLEELKALAAKNFGTWAPAALPEAPQTPATSAIVAEKTTSSAESGLVIEIVDMPGTQGEMMLGVKTLPRVDEQYDALSLAVAILGGPLVGRLDQNIREKNHWSYGARASLSAWKDGGMTQMETKVQLDKVGDALREILKEVERLRGETVPAEELSAAKAALQGLFLQRNRTVQSRAARLAGLEAMGLPASTMTDYPQRVEALTAAQVQAAAAAWLGAQGLKIVIAGPAAAIAPQLKGLGQVKIYSPDGKPRA